MRAERRWCSPPFRAWGVPRMAKLRPAVLGTYAVLLAYGGGLWLHLLHDGEYSQLYPMRSLAHGLHDATLALPIIGVAVALGLLGAARLAGRPGAGLPGWLAAAASACGVAFAASVAFGVLAPLHDLLLDGGAPQATAYLPVPLHMLRDG